MFARLMPLDICALIKMEILTKSTRFFVTQRKLDRFLSIPR